MTFYANLLPILREDLSKSMLFLHKEEGPTTKNLYLGKERVCNIVLKVLPSQTHLSWEHGDILSTILLLKVHGPP